MHALRVVSPVEFYDYSYKHNVRSQRNVFRRAPGRFIIERVDGSADRRSCARSVLDRPFSGRIQPPGYQPAMAALLTLSLYISVFLGCFIAMLHHRRD